VAEGTSGHPGTGSPRETSTKASTQTSAHRRSDIKGLEKALHFLTAPGRTTAQLANRLEELRSLGKDGAMEAQSTARKLLILQLDSLLPSALQHRNRLSAGCPPKCNVIPRCTFTDQSRDKAKQKTVLFSLE